MDRRKQKHSCDICTVSYKTVEELQKHFQSYFHAKKAEDHPNENFKVQNIECSECKEYFKLLRIFKNCNEFREHYENQHMEGRKVKNLFTCKICNKYFTNKEILQIHENSIHNNLPKRGRPRKSDNGPPAKKSKKSEKSNESDENLKSDKFLKQHISGGEGSKNEEKTCPFCNQKFLRIG